MVIIVNGKKEHVSSSISIAEYFRTAGLEEDRVVVEVNLSIIKKEQWGSWQLKENDNVEVLAFVGGG